MANRERDRNAILVLLALASGSVDAVSYLGLGRVFTANMTGNTVLLGLAIGQARIPAVTRSVVALGGFIVGVFLASLIVRRARQDAIWPRVVTAALGLECAILVGMAVWWQLHLPALDHYVQYELIGLVAVAMGIQSASARRLGVSSVTTVVVTTTLTNVVNSVVSRLPPRMSSTPTPVLAVQALVFVAYGVGAVTTGALVLRSTVAALWTAVGMVLLATLAALVRFPADDDASERPG